MNNNITLTEAVKTLYTTNTKTSVKEILGAIQIQHTHLKVDYRKVYNTWKRISGSSTKKSVLKTENASIVLDLTMTPTETVKGVVYSQGR